MCNQSTFIRLKLMNFHDFGLKNGAEFGAEKFKFNLRLHSENFRKM